MSLSGWRFLESGSGILENATGDELDRLTNWPLPPEPDGVPQSSALQWT